MSEFKPILPGTPEYTKALDEVKNIQPEQSNLKVKFDEVALGSTGCVMRHTVVSLSETKSKIIILFTKASMPVMQQVSGKLNALVKQLNIEGSFAEAEVSPVINKQFDFVLFDVPSFRAPMVEKYLVQEILNMYK